jgi:hypothetical protein
MLIAKSSLLNIQKRKNNLNFRGGHKVVIAVRLSYPCACACAYSFMETFVGVEIYSNLLYLAP